MEKLLLTGSGADVVQGELGDPGVELEQQGEGLADTTGGAEDGDLGELHGKRGVRLSKALE